MYNGEGGARVRTNVLVSDLNVRGVDVNDGRRLEIVAEGLPLYHGIQLAIDATLVSPLGRNNHPRCNSNNQDGAVLHEARLKKQRTYRDIVQSRRCHLLTAGLEIGGRWSEEFSGFIRHLAKNKAKDSPPFLFRSSQQILQRRWQGLIAVAAQKSLMKSILQDRMQDCSCEGGELFSWSVLM